MNRIFAKMPSVSFIPILIIFLLSLLVSGCATILRIHSDFIPAGSLRLAQVVAIGKRANLVTQSKETYEAMLASGIKDSEIVDGSVVMARIYCCGGITDNLSSERANAIMLFVPTGLNVSLGDIVEVRSGRAPANGDAGLLNTMTRIVEKYGNGDSHCWWDPKDDRLWLRVLYCDWMPNEGWIKQDGVNPAWYKPGGSSVPQN